MTSARDRIGAMQAGNQPPARGRRRPPDDEPAPATSPPADAPATTTGSDLTVVPDTPDPASKLASLLAGSGRQQEAGPDSRDALVDALTAPPPAPDPDLKLVTLGVRIPEYLATALRTMAFLRHRRQQELVREALQQYVPRDLLAECRASAQRGR